MLFGIFGEQKFCNGADRRDAFLCGVQRVESGVYCVATLSARRLKAARPMLRVRLRVGESLKAIRSIRKLKIVQVLHKLKSLACELFAYKRLNKRRKQLKLLSFAPTCRMSCGDG